MFYWSHFVYIIILYLDPTIHRIELEAMQLLRPVALEYILLISQFQNNLLDSKANNKEK